ncbi:MAG: CAP domain-containing protein [Candidatus Dormibacteria bacterium]
MRTSPPAARWQELDRTAAQVRAATPCSPDAGMPGWWRRAVLRSAYAGVVAAVCALAVHAGASAPPVHADGTADADLFALTNQDRASNGVRALAGSGTLSSIGEGAPYGGCGFEVYGRSVDMIQRNYFAHPILNCGQYVFSIMQAYGIRYQSAGENIGWNVGGGASSAASAINSAFMNSSEHRANILDANYTEAGMGSDNSGTQAWTGGGGSYQYTWMFSEEFAQVAGSAPPPTPAPQPPAPVAPAPPRNSTAPAPPAQAPVATAVPTAAPTPAPTATPSPTPAPTPTPLPTALPTLTLPPDLAPAGGLLYDSVESILASYLIG